MANCRTEILSPVRSKLRDKYNTFRHRIPYSKDELKKQYKEKIMKDRDKILFAVRNVPYMEDVRSSLEIILHTTFLQLKADLTKIYKSGNTREGVFNLDDEISYEEEFKQALLQEQEEWILNEYEQFIQSGEELINLESEDSSDIIICPVCKSGYFQWQEPQTTRLICSNCRITFLTKQSMPSINTQIFSQYHEHNQICSYNPQFLTIPETESSHTLYIICDQCNFMNIIL